MKRPEIGLDYIQGRTKRQLDILGGLIIGTALLPVGAVVGAEVAMEHRTLRPLFTQKRVGKGGDEYTNWKFQSLRTREAAVKLLAGSAHPDASLVGKILRKSGLDEIPQIANVIRGDISLVGFRPLPRGYIDYYQTLVSPTLFDEWYGRYCLNPGLTGPGQLYSNQFAEHTSDVIGARMEIDIRSFDNASLRNDLAAIAQTPFTLLRRSVEVGENSMEEVPSPTYK